MMKVSRPPETWLDGSQLFDSPWDVWGHIDIAMVRNRVEWEDGDGDNGEKAVQLGAGRKIIEGWDNLEYPDWDGENPGSLSRYANSSVSQFASYHTLDHLSPDGVVNTLREIQRCLIPGGTFINIVPHYLSQLANECIMHKSRFGIDTFRNIFSERQFDQYGPDGERFSWELGVGANFIYGQTERNMVLVTQLIKSTPVVANYAGRSGG